MKFQPSEGVHVVMPAAVLSAVFDECDRYDDVETGGRIIGTFSERERLEVRVEGMIDAGPNAKRARTSFFQDGDYQTEIFRSVESGRPEIEHVGTWHSHHCNGYPHLSDGDVETYRRTVNHRLHNIAFWYALLVTKRVRGLARYHVRHFIFFRGDDDVYEIPNEQVEVVETPVTWLPEDPSPRHSESTKVEGLKDVTSGSERPPSPTDRSREKRELDSRRVGPTSAASGEELRSGDNTEFEDGRSEHIHHGILRELYPDLDAFMNRPTGRLYWKGHLRLANGTRAQVAVQGTSKRDSEYVAIIVVDERELPRVTSKPRRTPWLSVKEAEDEANRLIVRGFVEVIESAGRLNYGSHYSGRWAGGACDHSRPY